MKPLRINTFLFLRFMSRHMRYFWGFIFSLLFFGYFTVFETKPKTHLNSIQYSQEYLQSGSIKSEPKLPFKINHAYWLKGFQERQVSSDIKYGLSGNLNLIHKINPFFNKDLISKYFEKSGFLIRSPLKIHLFHCYWAI